MMECDPMYLFKFSRKPLIHTKDKALENQQGCVYLKYWYFLSQLPPLKCLHCLLLHYSPGCFKRRVPSKEKNHYVTKELCILTKA